MLYEEDDVEVASWVEVAASVEVEYWLEYVEDELYPWLYVDELYPWLDVEELYPWLYVDVL